METARHTIVQKKDTFDNLLKKTFKRTANWEECSPEEKVMKKNFVVRVIEQL